MAFELFLSPQGHLHVREVADPAGGALDGAVGKRVHAAFAGGTAQGLLHLATTELQSSLPPTFGFARDFARLYLTRLCQTPTDGEGGAVPPVPQPSETDLAFQVLHAPPMHGCEYLTADVLATWWSELDSHVRAEIEHHKGGVQTYLSERNPQWRLVGRVTFHLAENKRDPEHPFAFLATFIPRLSAQGSEQHEPLGKALQQYAGAKNRPALLSLLVPIQRATERSPLIKEMVESGEIYHPLAWTPREAYRFLQDIPVFEESGLVVRVPDWWKSSHPPRPVVNVKIDARKKSALSVSDLLDFSVNVTLEGEPLTEAELERLLESVGGLVAIKGKWVEVDREKLAEALKHWKKVEHETRESGLSFYEGMRLLSGVPRQRDAASSAGQDHEWVGLTAGLALEETLKKLRSPESLANADPPGLRAQLRPYQQTGVSWLRFVTGLGLGACLADDMGLGKTVQVIGLLLHRKSNRKDHEPTQAKPSLLVVPASLLANWKAELERFAPTISFLIAHPSGNMTGNRQVACIRSLHADDDCSEPAGPCEQHGLDADPHMSDEERESSQVGYRIRGIEPPDLARYPNSVKLLFWGWVVEYGLVAKDRELAKGLDKDGVPMQALDPQTIKHRKSEVGPTFKNAPPLEPPSARSRVRSLLKGRAHVNSAEFWWGFDSVTGASFAKILIRQRDAYGRDVFGLSPDGTAWVQANALKRWEEWKASAHVGRPATKAPGPPGAKPVKVVPITGRIDIENMDLMGGEAEIRAAIEAGRFTGFRRLNARGEKWKPPQGSPPAVEKQDAQGLDLLITTYGMLSRTQWLREHDWDLVILDEAQAIKNSGTRQSRTVKELKSAARVAMTGTPVENRLSDLWSLFDFLNPGLLGGAKAFADFVKQMEARASYQPLRSLVGPYILRRLKTDKRVIADLPEKVEMSAFCSLSREQAALYEQAVRDLAQKLEEADGIQRRGLVLAQLMKLKQICNHPAQLVGSGDYAPEHSGKFQRLAEICEELGERQEKALVFTQFREITGPLAHLLEGVFGRPGLVLHGGTPVAQRQRLVESFQSEDGPPFFVLSLKAGGTGLNLTAACHVIHFDRWWNPAVENQATDRTFRIGQKRNVLVHKFVCRGTVEERIDAMIAEKSSLSGDVIDGTETLLTEMSDTQLLDFVRLDVHKALDN